MSDQAVENICFRTLENILKMSDQALENISDRTLENI